MANLCYHVSRKRLNFNLLFTILAKCVNHMNPPNPTNNSVIVLLANMRSNKSNNLKLESLLRINLLEGTCRELSQLLLIILFRNCFLKSCHIKGNPVSR